MNSASSSQQWTELLFNDYINFKINSYEKNTHCYNLLTFHFLADIS